MSILCKLGIHRWLEKRFVPERYRASIIQIAFYARRCDRCARIEQYVSAPSLKLMGWHSISKIEKRMSILPSWHRKLCLDAQAELRAMLMEARWLRLF